MKIMDEVAPIDEPELVPSAPPPSETMPEPVEPQIKL
jgi:hypothetical protein